MKAQSDFIPGAVKVSQNHNPIFRVPIQNTSYKTRDLNESFPPSSAVVAPRFEVHTNDVCRA
jgi:hypothetical protein